MTLTTRLSLFFLGALAAVLIGFSATLYSLARTYLHRQIDDRLEAALNVLSATAEVKPNGVEWEAKERPVSLKPPPGAEPIAWRVCDDSGRTIDACRFGSIAGDSASCRVRSRRVAADVHGAAETDKEHRDEEENNDRRYPFLLLSAALPLTPVEVTLRTLLLLLSGLSLGAWLTAALIGRWLCRRALAPVTRMASAARAMRAADRDQRLPVAASGDELQELGQAFNDLLTRLQESYERQARFSGDASHQLRTPLTSLLGQIEIALRRPRPAEEYHQVLTVLHEQALRMRQIVETLLFLARADAEAKAPQLERLDLRAWLREHLASWAGHARAVDFQTETSGDEPLWVQAQAPLLAQLVDTLLDNACKYSAAGTPITISLVTEKDAVCLTVTDAGCGIAAEDIPHLFEPFYRSPQARQQGVAGLGLGLAVAERIALALGGSLHVRSQLGQESHFTLRLPTPASGGALAPRVSESLGR
jgi:two-component system OmpR family sensor kinase